jgi:hypothetical protein
MVPELGDKANSSHNLSRSAEESGVLETLRSDGSSLTQKSVQLPSAGKPGCIKQEMLTSGLEILVDKQGLIGYTHVAV